MEAIRVEDLKRGDVAVFDPLYGPEKIMEITETTTLNGLRIMHMHVNTGRKDQHRYIVRGWAEPVVRVMSGITEPQEL